MDELDRFVRAQKLDFERAFCEIESGKKKTHWMWYIFPQICGLGQSEMDSIYSIKSLDEAKSYMQNSLLSQNLITITKALLKSETNDAKEIFGSIDSLKLRSSLTLFSLVSENNVFNEALIKFFDGKKDERTLAIIKKLSIKKLSI